MVKLLDQCPVIRSTTEKEVVVVNERSLAALLALGIFCHESALKVSVHYLLHQLFINNWLWLSCTQHHSDRICEYLLQLIKALPQVQWQHSQTLKKGVCVCVCVCMCMCVCVCVCVWYVCVLSVCIFNHLLWSLVRERMYNCIMCTCCESIESGIQWCTMVYNGTMVYSGVEWCVGWVCNGVQWCRVVCGVGVQWCTVV